MAEFALTSTTLSAERRQAGTDYLISLRKHGIVPQALSWAVDESEQFHLLMVTSLVDRLGPSSIYDALFRAYERAVTPTSIDPWIVTLFSPNSAFGAEFLNNPIMTMDIRAEFRDDKGRVVPDAIRPEITISPFRLRPDWIYALSAEKLSVDTQLRGWHRFVKKLDRKAA
ncbi:MAG: hypothetical protein DI527_12125 [Chelatococcus sp.]|nr:MAG: hypothetical protein DI527_12125 [Chelatococcus sp.]